MSSGVAGQDAVPGGGVRPVSRRAGMLRTLGLDIAGPLVVYRVCRAAGVSEVWSLVISGCPPAVGVLLDWLRWRTLEVVGAVVLAGIGVSVVLALVTEDPQIVLLESAAITAAFGVACLVSLTRRRPLIFYFAQAFYGGRHSVDGAELDADYDRYTEAQSYWRTVTTVWAVVYLIEAGAKAILVQRVSVGTALTYNRTVPWVVSGLLFAWTFWWGSRLSAQKPASNAPESPPPPGNADEEPPASTDGLGGRRTGL